MIAKAGGRTSPRGSANDVSQNGEGSASRRSSGNPSPTDARARSMNGSDLHLDIGAANRQQPGTSRSIAADNYLDHPLNRYDSTEPLLPASPTDPSRWSPSSPVTEQAGAASRRASAQSAAADMHNTHPLNSDEDSGFKKFFPGGLEQAEKYLKDKSMGMTRAPGYLASHQYPAPQSWDGLAAAEKNRLMDRYLSVWDPEPKRADFDSQDEFAASNSAYHDRIGKYKQDGNYNMQQYWDDTVSTQNSKYKSFVDNQTKRLAIATKAYDDFIANPGQYRVKPDDPYDVRKQMTGKQDGKRDAMFLQREALDFGKNNFYKLDGRNLSELRSSFLSLFGRNSSRIEQAFQFKKNALEDELYRYAGSRVSRDVVEQKKKALQDRFNGDVDIAVKNMDLMYKRVALYGTIGTLSISAISALLWKAIDEARGGSNK